MVRGTFANVRLRNQLLADGREGFWTTYQPTGEVMRIYDASVRYQEAGTPLVVLGGKEYGTGSSRDWAAKGTRSSASRRCWWSRSSASTARTWSGWASCRCSILPGESRATYGLDGSETFDILGISDGLQPGMHVTVRAHRRTA